MKPSREYRSLDNMRLRAQILKDVQLHNWLKRGDVARIKLCMLRS